MPQGVAGTRPAFGIERRVHPNRPLLWVIRRWCMKMAAGHKDVQVAYKWLNRGPARCPAWIVDQEGVKRGLLGSPAGRRTSADERARKPPTGRETAFSRAGMANSSRPGARSSFLLSLN